MINSALQKINIKNKDRKRERETERESVSTNLVYSAVEETPRIMLLKSCAWPSFFFLAFPTVSPFICQTVFFSQTIHTWPPQTSTIMLTSIYIISLKSLYSSLIF